MKSTKCKFSHKLNAYADGELSQIEFEKLHIHLKSCPLCQQELREISNINSFLNEFEPEEVPEYLNQRILATVREKETRVSWFGRRITTFSLAASLAVSFLTGIYLADLTYQKSVSDVSSTTSSSVFSFGEETLYSFYEGDQ